jgi:hypothetical protein
MTVRSSEDTRAPSRYADHRSPLRYRSSALGVGGSVWVACIVERHMTPVGKCTNPTPVRRLRILQSSHLQAMSQADMNMLA